MYKGAVELDYVEELPGCPHPGCKEHMKKELMDPHIVACGCKTVPCENPECTEQVKIKDYNYNVMCVYIYICFLL